jgi:putative inorganic carbon (HCO3(-)) transporter
LPERIDAVIRFFLYVLIFWLPYSPAVIETCVIIGLILWILKRSIAGKRPNIIPATPLNKPILFFLTVCILSASGSVFWQESLPNFLTKTLEWFIVYFLVIEAVTTRKHIYIILGVFLLTLVATALDSLIQYYLTYKDIFLGHVIEPGTRATAGFKTPNGLGAYLIVALPVVVAGIFKRNEDLRHRLLFSLLFFLLIWSLAVTFSRGAWVTAFLGIMVFVLMYMLIQRHSEFYLVSGILFVSILLWAYFGCILTGDSHSDSLRYETIYWRIHIWKDTFNMIQDSPWLGHGINTFMQIFEAYRTDRGNPTYAHNSYFQLAAETGLFGLVSFLWIFVNLFRSFLADLASYAMKNDDLILLAMGLLSGIFAFLAHSFFDNHFYSLQLSVYLWFMVGLLFVMVREIKWQNLNVR